MIARLATELGTTFVTNFAVSMLMAAVAPVKFKTKATNPADLQAHVPSWLRAAQMSF
jgi:hypothetical protein